MVSEKIKEMIVFSHQGKNIKEITLVFHHHVWMNKKENHEIGINEEFIFFLLYFNG